MVGSRKYGLLNGGVDFFPRQHGVCVWCRRLSSTCRIGVEDVWLHKQVAAKGRGQHGVSSRDDGYGKTRKDRRRERRTERRRDGTKERKRILDTGRGSMCPKPRKGREGSTLNHEPQSRFYKLPVVTQELEMFENLAEPDGTWHGWEPSSSS